MSHQGIDLKELERKAWTSFHRDGLLEAYLGLLLLAGFVGGMTPNWHLLGPILQLSAVAVFFAAKRLVTIPRMGLVKFGPERKAKRKRTAVVMSTIFLLTVTLLIMTLLGRVGWIRENHTAFSFALGLGVWFVFAVMAYWGDSRRLYLIGFAFAVAITASELSDDPIPFLGVGSCLLIVGLVQLALFLRRYPLIPETDFREYS
ncbi:MAG: hypothetical protein AMS18_05620 [Gemmatimonas sp. SG8_17]|nr:MAG: hypothetical protein AMS18_05620 [Gemmatimonas sp. SG8_17]